MYPVKFKVPFVYEASPSTFDKVLISMRKHHPKLKHRDICGITKTFRFFVNEDRTCFTWCGNTPNTCDKGCPRHDKILCVRFFNNRSADD